MARSRSPYPPAFRQEAVRLIRTADAQRPVPKIAHELGVVPETLRNRVRQAEIDAGIEKAHHRGTRESQATTFRREVKV